MLELDLHLFRMPIFTAPEILAVFGTVTIYCNNLPFSHLFTPSTSPVESVQDFLIKLDINPLIHLLEISTFSLNNVILRLTKIMNRADKNWAHF